MLLDVCNFYGDAQAVYEQYGGVVLGEAALEGERIAEALGPKGKGALLSNHGLLTVGDTVDEAAFLFTSMEIACGVQLEVEKAGLPKKIIGDEEAEFNFRMASHPETLYWEFQPYYDFEKAMSDNFENLRVEDLDIRV
ncbi:hypothetical protein MMC08_005417 [Hypocenomyce scalaris]|nr:hypothetical protein [Hypocenomyce scalaris]